METRCLLFCTMLLVGLSAFSSAPASGASPKIQFEEVEYDFGLVDQYKKLTHEFRFKNAGDADLEISKVEASCACVAVTPSRKSIPPGGEGGIKITFNSENRRGKGRYKNRVFSNDPSAPRVELVVRATVKGGFKIIPTSLYFTIERRSPNPGALTKIVDILYPVAKKTSILRIEASSPGMSARVASGTELGARLEVTMDKDLPLGQINEKITVHTSLKDHPPLAIPVLGQVVGDIIVRPNRMFFGAIDAGAKAVRKVSVRFKSPGIALTRIEADKKQLQVSCAPHSDGAGYDVAARLYAGDKTGLLKQTIKLFTSSKEQPVIEIPVTAFVRK